MMSSASKKCLFVLALSSLIASAEAQKVATCYSSSPQCCWVVRIWQLMGQTTKVSPTSSTACCSPTWGVTCSVSSVISIVWNYKGLSGSIPSEIGNLTDLRLLWLQGNLLTGSLPSEIGNLTNLRLLGLYSNRLTGSIPSEIGNMRNLQYFYLYDNQLSGSIPSSIGSLRNLQLLDLKDNPNLSGQLTPLCTTRVYASNTGINLCGCSSQTSPSFIFPPANTTRECLQSGPASSLSKRILTFAQNIDTLSFTCHNDSNSNPFQDCLNTMAAFCNSTYMGTDETRKSNCRTVVDTITNGMNSYWQKVRRECGQWEWNGFRGDFSSPNCAAANADLRANAYYLLHDGTKSYVTSQLTESVRLGLWNNQVLKVQLEGS